MPMILVAPSLQALQLLLRLCELELNFACMTVNAKKSACLRFGPRYKNACSSVMVCGLPVNWVTSARYLGVYLESSSTFKCTFQSNKAKFYKAFNCIFETSAIVFYRTRVYQMQPRNGQNSYKNVATTVAKLPKLELAHL